MMNKPTDTGMNRTGIATSPIDSQRTIEGAEAAATTGRGDGRVLEPERVLWARDAGPLGHVPHQPTVLIDKLGERLAYERTGTRLYDALLAKYEVAHVHQGGPTRSELEEIREAEHAHMLLVREALLGLGADPTAMTPCADLVGVAGLGWVQALTDPRTTLTQCLDVILMAEVSDVDGWLLLLELAELLGHDELAARFRDAMVVEETHVRKVRGWLTTAVIGQAGAEQTI
jgi:hypothetical protein